MAKTVAQVLTAATDSVSLINAVKAGTYDVVGMNQDDINRMVQRNVDHLGIILAYDGTKDQPDIVYAPDDKSSYTGAITTGNTYIEDHS